MTDYNRPPVAGGTTPTAWTLVTEDDMRLFPPETTYPDDETVVEVDPETWTDDGGMSTSYKLSNYGDVYLTFYNMTYAPGAPIPDDVILATLPEEAWPAEEVPFDYAVLSVDGVLKTRGVPENFNVASAAGTYVSKNPLTPDEVVAFDLSQTMLKYRTDGDKLQIIGAATTINTQRNELDAVLDLPFTADWHRDFYPGTQFEGVQVYGEACWFYPDGGVLFTGDGFFNLQFYIDTEDADD